MENDIMVSICCATYNHEKYIYNALDGFLMQKADFQYEIIIHDDASTDNTASIIKEYEKKFPRLIKPIYQKQNQYSQGVNIFTEFLLPHARGKYIALCEGDDYWIDENKLAKQVAYLEKHLDYSCTCHAIQYLKDGTIISSKRNIGTECDITPDMILKHGGCMPTASMCYRKNIITQMPDYMQNAPIGDYPAEIWLAISGKVRYFPDFMSVYRVGHEGAWSQTNKMWLKEKWIKFYESSKTWLAPLDEDTGYQYKSSIYYSIINDMQKLYELGAEDYKIIKNMINDETIGFDKAERTHLKLQLMKTAVKKHFPVLVKIKRRLKK